MTRQSKHIRQSCTILYKNKLVAVTKQLLFMKTKVVFYLLCDHETVCTKQYIRCSDT